MSRAEITRISLRLTVNATNSLRPCAVFPNAQYRFSRFECAGSERTMNGSWKKTSSASSGVTRWRSQFFPAFASSQLKPIQAASGSFWLISCIYHTYTNLRRRDVPHPYRDFCGKERGAPDLNPFRAARSTSGPAGMQQPESLPGTPDPSPAHGSSTTRRWPLPAFQPAPCPQSS